VRGFKRAGVQGCEDARVRECESARVDARIMEDPHKPAHVRSLPVPSLKAR
jgi:hypothetical protein